MGLFQTSNCNRKSKADKRLPREQSSLHPTLLRPPSHEPHLSKTFFAGGENFK